MKFGISWIIKKHIMKNYLFIALLFAITSTVGAQSKEKYCMISFIESTGRKVKIYTDDGNGQPHILEDNLTGNTLLFDSEIAGLNYMIEKGWTLVNNTSAGNNSTVEHYFLLKKTE